MEVLDLIAAKRNLARRVLDEFITGYMAIDDTERLEKSNTILDEVNSYLQIEGNLIFPFIRKRGGYDEVIDRARAVHSKIEDVTEHAIMMHVDEPSGEYFNDMARLAEYLDQAKKVDEETIFPWARKYLSDADQLLIAKHLKEQMAHESLPSSGMTIY